MTPIQELLKQLNEVKSENSFINTTINLVIDLVEEKIKKEKLIINKAHADGVMWGLQAVTGNKVSETNYYEEKYGINRDSK